MIKILLNTLYVILCFCGIVYIESQTFIIERLFNLLFHEKEIPVEVMPGFTSNSSIDTEEIETRNMMSEEIKFMNEYVFNNVDSKNTVVNIDLEDDDYIPLTPSEVSN